MKTTYALMLALGLTAVMAIHPGSARAADGGTDVFADEGDVDFDNIPTDVSKVPGAPAMKVQAAAKDTSDDAPVAKPTEKHVDDDAAPVEHHEIHRRNVKHDAKPKAQPAPASDDAPAVADVAAMPTDDASLAAAPAPAADDVAADAAAPAPHAKRAATSVSHDTNGFRTTGKDCPMFREPASEGEPMLTVKSEKRIWVEPKGEWVRAYSKAGPGYISADCLK